MEINNIINQQYQLNKSQDSTDKMKEIAEKNKNVEDDKLKKAVSEFTAVFLNQMFKSMRSTLPDEKLINGGFAEDVFTDMMDQEISEIGAKQDNFKQLNETLYEQLSRMR